jgi:DNA-binding YbaB/EbfC family protein
MFKDLSQLGGLMKLLPNLGKLREEMENLQQRLGQVTAEGDAGGGMVKVRMNGKFELLSCTLSEDAVRSGDRELLEDLIKAAVNQAQDRVRQQNLEETGKMAATLGLPPGMALPGLNLPGT